MDIIQFDFYIDRAINGDYLSQTKNFQVYQKKLKKILNITHQLLKKR